MGESWGEILANMHPIHTTHQLNKKLAVLVCLQRRGDVTVSMCAVSGIGNQFCCLWIGPAIKKEDESATEAMHPSTAFLGASIDKKDFF